MAFDHNSFKKFLHFCVERKVSGIHLREGEVPYIRMKGDLKRVSSDPLTQQDMKVIASLLFSTPEALKKFDWDASGGLRFQELAKVFKQPG